MGYFAILDFGLLRPSGALDIAQNDANPLFRPARVCSAQKKHMSGLKVVSYYGPGQSYLWGILPF